MNGRDARQQLAVTFAVYSLNVSDKILTSQYRTSDGIVLYQTTGTGVI